MERVGQKKARRIAAVIVFILAVSLIQDRARLLLDGHLSLQWPTVIGEVLHAESDQVAGGQAGRGWSIRVGYQYEVDGEVYEGNRLEFSRQLGGRTRIQADDELRKYVPGGQILVHYDPNRPHRAVIWPGADQRAYFGLTVGIGLILIALLFWTVPTRSVRRSSSAS